MDDNKTTIQARTIEVSVWKALGILATSIISATVISVFSTVRILQSDHYALVSLRSDVDAIKSQSVSKDVLLVQLQSIDFRLAQIEKKLY